MEVNSAVSEAKSLKAKQASRGIGRKATTSVKTEKIPCRKPKPFEWVRVHPDGDEYSIILSVFEFYDGDRDEEAATAQKRILYAVHPDIASHPDLEDDLTKYREYILACTRKGKLIVWDHGYSEKENSWIDSEDENIARARTTWIRQISDTGNGVYNRKEAIQNWAGPDWEKLIAGRSFDELLIEALSDKFVSTIDHPIFKELLGK